MERADLGGRAHVCASTQLPGVLALADLHHPHHIAVLLSEQRHRAQALGLRQRRGDRADAIAAGDPLVDTILDVAELLLAQSLAVAEVEAQLVRPHV
jgi:hypothetical protein